MSVSIAEILRRWQAIDVESVAKEVMRENEDELIGLNQDQLLQGRGTDGKVLPEIKAYKTDKGDYREVKERMNPRANGRYDMRYTGESYAGMKLYLDADKFEIRTDGIAQRYEDGSEGNGTKGRIFGLTPDNKEVYRNETLIPGMAVKIAQKTGAKLNTQ